MMLQIDASIRSAAEADIVLTPRFARSSWRDFHLAELFREAGREEAESLLPHLANWQGRPLGCGEQRVAESATRPDGEMR
jgi:hypothetical protein